MSSMITTHGGGAGISAGEGWPKSCAMSRKEYASLCRPFPGPRLGSGSWGNCGGTGSALGAPVSASVPDKMGGGLPSGLIGGFPDATASLMLPPDMGLVGPEPYEPELPDSGGSGGSANAGSVGRRGGPPHGRGDVGGGAHPARRRRRGGRVGPGVDVLRRRGRWRRRAAAIDGRGRVTSLVRPELFPNGSAAAPWAARLGKRCMAARPPERVSRNVVGSHT
jgi:hypothetical protein